MKTIIEMARKAGLLPEESNIAYQHPFFEQQIERFADLVRAAEREENAKVCEKVAVDVFTQHESHSRRLRHANQSKGTAKASVGGADSRREGRGSQISSRQ